MTGRAAVVVLVARLVVPALLIPYAPHHLVEYCHPLSLPRWFPGTLPAVVGLGRHYPIDSVGGILVAAAAIGLAACQWDRGFPSTLTDRSAQEASR